MPSFFRYDIITSNISFLGEDMDIVDGLIELRILLNSFCDGFSNNSLNKNLSLSTRTKILFLLENKDLCPSDMIASLCIAKTNLANLLKGMIGEDIIISYKNLDNSKNVFYRITEKGTKELKIYKEKLKENINENIQKDEKITQSMCNIINFLRGEKND